MNVIYEEKIREALSVVQPHSIAVDFVGLDWQSYLDIGSARQIIVSPTVGTHPAAIEQIVAAIEGAWDAVYFLDELHTKLYIGGQFVAMGNFNLAKTGVTESGREPVGMLSKNTQFVADARLLFASLKKRAQQDYPDTPSKKIKLAQLRATLAQRSLCHGAPQAPA